MTAQRFFRHRNEGRSRVSNVYAVPWPRSAMQNYTRRFHRHRRPCRASIYGHQKHVQNTTGYIFGGRSSGGGIFCIELCFITTPDSWWPCASCFISW